MIKIYFDDKNLILNFFKSQHKYDMKKKKKNCVWGVEACLKNYHLKNYYFIACTKYG